MNWSIPARAVLAAVLINLLWGGNPVALKLALEAFPPFWSGLLRFVLGSACVAAWARYARIPLRPTREEWPAVIGVGLMVPKTYRDPHSGRWDTLGQVCLSSGSKRGICKCWRQPRVYRSCRG